MQTNENRRESLPAPWLAVVQRAFGYIAAQHFFEAHCLSAKLHHIAAIRLRFASLVFHRVRLPKALPAAQADPFLAPSELHHIALAGYAEPGRAYVNSAHDTKITPALIELRIVRLIMHQRTVSGAIVFRPELFYMY